MTEKPDHDKFLEDLDNAADNFIDNNYKKVITISHNDADGISCLHLIQNLLHNRYEYDYFIYNRSVSWKNYLSGILSQNSSEKNAFIFTDVGSNLKELIPIIKERKEHFFILDHHELDIDINEIKIPENLYFVNPTVHGFDGLDHIAGATLTYKFVKKIKPTIIKKGWLAVIGIAGDTLKSTDKLESFNREVYEELVSEEVINDHQGLILFGGMHETIKNGLKNSILPFLEGLGGENDQKIKLFLKKMKIDPGKKVIDLDPSEIERIQESIKSKSHGNYSTLPQKTGILKFIFEHALLLNILCFKNINAAISITQRNSITHYAQKLYYEYVSNLVKNLRTLNLEKLPGIETEKALYINVGGKIPPSNWSDTASFVTVNEVLDPFKILFLGGEDKKNQMIKLSIRCSRKFLARSNGVGVNTIISRIKGELGGSGGGHKLAGGIRLSKPSFNRLMESFDKYIN